MRKKKPARKPKPERKPLSAKTREADERLREALRNADLKAFGRLLPKAIKRTDGGTVPGFLALSDAEAAKVEKRVRAAGMRASAKKS